MGKQWQKNIKLMEDMLFSTPRDGIIQRFPKKEGGSEDRQ
jgi:hypothetical protein